MSFALLQQITNSKEDNINCDLSVISIDLFDQLQELILKYGTTKIACLSINRSTSVKYERNVEKIRKEKGKKEKVPPPAHLEGSIYSQKDYLEADIVALMARLLPKTKSLKSLTLHSFQFTPIDFDILFQALSLNKSLRTLKFQGMVIKKKVFDRLTEALKHRFIINLTIKNCNLSDKITESFLDLIRCHTLIQKKAERIAEAHKKQISLVCISNIDFRDNKFTTSFIQQIVSAINSSPVFRLDLRDNIQIPTNYNVSPKIIVGNTPAFSSPNSRIRSNLDYRIRLRENEHQLEIENQKLKSKLEMLGSKRVATISKRTYAIGDRANELVEHINELDKLCTDIIKKEKKKKRP